MLINTPEEERALRSVEQVCKRLNRACITWDVADNFQTLVGQLTMPAQRDPLAALDSIDKSDGEIVFVLRDFHECWGNASIKRKIKNLAQRFKYSKKTILVIAPVGKVPDELKDEVVTIEFSLPNTTELESVLEPLVIAPGVRVNLTKLGREKLLQAAVGLTANQAQRVFAKAIVQDGALNDRGIDLVTEEKKQIIRESQALEFYSVTETPDHVGGLDVLKQWLRLRERAFSTEAREYGLPAPKGIALIGIPGTGKSLTAKMIGGLWHLPLVRLDVGSLFGSLVGESEERARRALRIAETVSPCVLWIDELEKSMASGGLDGGTSTRVFGTILTWMQEKTTPCFVVATANNISALPPELLRKGRFDEIFFLDLPTLEERKEIFKVHLTKRNRIIQDFDISTLAQDAAGYVGAEIEQAIIDAMYIGFTTTTIAM
jgi:ATP-dependent 26S proteasome regulatory subunit